MRGSSASLLCFIFLLFVSPFPACAEGAYTLKAGDTLFSVSRTSGVPIDILTSYNGITDASRLKVGTVIQVPSIYAVKKGDTLYGIARSLSVPVGRILVLNKLSQDSLIKAGQRLFVPASPAASAAAVAAQSTNAGQAGTAAWAPLEVVWPHPGKRDTEKGKLWWLVFQGSAGDVVRSATAGDVKWAATWWGYGKVLVIRSVDGTTFVYGGNRELLVKVGDRVLPGTEIAKLGGSIQGGGTKLYFSINDANGKTMDPEKFFSAQSQS